MAKIFFRQVILQENEQFKSHQRGGSVVVEAIKTMGIYNLKYCHNKCLNICFFSVIETSNLSLYFSWHIARCIFWNHLLLSNTLPMFWIAQWQSFWQENSHVRFPVQPLTFLSYYNICTYILSLHPKYSMRSNSWPLPWHLALDVSQTCLWFPPWCIPAPCSAGGSHSRWSHPSSAIFSKPSPTCCLPTIWKTVF